MKTADKILLEVREHKTCSRAMLYQYFKRLGIAPVGVRQRPQHYPDDTALRVLTHLGLVGEINGECGRPGCPGPLLQTDEPFVTMRQLRAERTKAAKARPARRAA